MAGGNAGLSTCIVVVVEATFREEVPQRAGGGSSNEEQRNCFLPTRLPNYVYCIYSQRSQAMTAIDRVMRAYSKTRNLTVEQTEFARRELLQFIDQLLAVGTPKAPGDKPVE
jgi:hypothetical protein